MFFITDDEWLRLLREAATLGHASGFLGSADARLWMPPGGASYSAQDRATLDVLYRRALTNPALREACQEVLERHGVDSNLGSMARCTLGDIDHEDAKTDTWVRAKAAAEAVAFPAWKQALEGGDAAPALTALEGLLHLERELGQFKANRMNSPCPYGALLHWYEPGLTVSMLNDLLPRAAQAASRLHDMARGGTPPRSWSDLGIRAGQGVRRFGLEVLGHMGVTSQNARFFTGAHPFLAPVSPRDVRIVERPHYLDAMAQIRALVHEGGHGTYELGMLAEWFRTPRARPTGLAMHEAISRFWEVLIMASRLFWELFAPRLRFQASVGFGVDSHCFADAFMRLDSTHVRVVSDPATYMWHVLLRYELERDMINGDLEPRNLVDAWRARVRELFGSVSDNPKEGPFQDPHWWFGSFGYFPTYAVGTLWASALFRKVSRLFTMVCHSGEPESLGEVVEWLRTNIFQWGSRYTGPQLIERIVPGVDPVQAFEEIMTQRVNAAYGIN